MDERQNLISELLTPSPVPAKSYEQLEAEYVARREPVPPSVVMMAAAEHPGF